MTEVSTNYTLVKVDLETGKETPVIVAEGIHPGQAFFDSARENPGTIFRYDGTLPNGHRVHKATVRILPKAGVTYGNAFGILEKLMGDRIDQSSGNIWRTSISNGTDGTQKSVSLKCQK